MRKIGFARGVYRRVTSHFVVFLSFFTFAFLVGSLIFIPRLSSAESFDQARSDVSIEVSPVISLVLSERQLNLTTAPRATGSISSSSLTAKVSTNNLTGYYLTMSTIADDTDLTHTNNTDVIPSTTNGAPAALQVNTWGYNSTNSSKDFELIPPLSSPKRLKSATAPITDDVTAVTVGVNVNTDIPSGTYQNTLVFTATANVVPEPSISGVSPNAARVGDTITISGINYYAGTGSSQVTGVRVGTAKCTTFTVISDSSLTCVVPAMEPGDSEYAVYVTTDMGVGVSNKVISVYTPPYVGPIQGVTIGSCPTELSYASDNRDGNTYLVQKLADGNCWMLTNLAYAGGGEWSESLGYPDDRNNGLIDGTGVTNGQPCYNSNTEPCYYIHVDSNVTNLSANSPIGKIPSLDMTGGGNVSGTDSRRQYGYRYNWCAANGNQQGTNTCMGGTDTTSHDTNISVCPSGWRLPGGGISASATGNDFGALNSAINGGSTSSPAGLLSTWLGMYGGLWSGSFQYQSNSYYWSSTPSTASNGAYALNFSGSSVSPGTGTFGEASGFAIRCIHS